MLHITRLGMRVLKPLKNQSRLFLSTLALVSASFFVFPASALAGPVNASELIELTNQERETLSLPALSPNHELTQAAFRKATDLLEKGYFAHTTPEGKPFYRWVEEEGYYYLYAGENLAIDFQTSEGVVAAWMASPTHRANVVNEHYSEIGLVALRGNWQDRETTVVVQLFGSLLGDSPTVLGRTFENITNNLDLRRGELVSLATDLVLLPSLAGPRYFDVILRPERSARIAITDSDSLSIAASPLTLVREEETFRTLLKARENGASAAFALTESDNGDLVTTPVRYPTVREIVQTLSEQKISFLVTPESLSRNIMLAGVVLLLLLAAYEEDIRRTLKSA